MLLFANQAGSKASFGPSPETALIPFHTVFKILERPYVSPGGASGARNDRSALIGKVGVDSERDFPYVLERFIRREQLHEWASSHIPVES